MSGVHLPVGRVSVESCCARCVPPDGEQTFAGRDGRCEFNRPSEVVSTMRVCWVGLESGWMQ